MQSIKQFIDYLNDVYNDQELDTLEYGWNYFIGAYGNWYKEPYLKEQLVLMSPYKITYKKRDKRLYIVVDFERGNDERN